MIADGDHLDSAWLPAQLLQSAGWLGSLRGLGLGFDRRRLQDVDFDAPDAPVEFLKMQLWGNRASEVLDLLRNPVAFPESTTLSKIKVKFWLDGDAEQFAIADITISMTENLLREARPSAATLTYSLSCMKCTQPEY